MVNKVKAWQVFGPRESSSTIAAWDGTWDDQLKKLQFKRSIADTGEVQTYIGFLFDQSTYFNDSPLSTPQDYSKPYWVLAGSFTSVGGFENPDRAAAGWGWFAVTAAT